MNSCDANTTGFLREWRSQPFHITSDYETARRWLTRDYFPVLGERLSRLGFVQEKDTRTLIACLLATMDPSMRNSDDDADRNLVKAVDVFVYHTTARPATIAQIASLFVQFNHWKRGSQTDVLKWLKEQVIMCKAKNDDKSFRDILRMIKSSGTAEDVQDAANLYQKKWS